MTKLELPNKAVLILGPVWENKLQKGVDPIECLLATGDLIKPSDPLKGSWIGEYVNFNGKLIPNELFHQLSQQEKINF